LYNASNRKTEEEKAGNFDRVSHGIALVELMGYIEDTKNNANNTAPVFK
jgi:uncharacterized membrane-anchored protein